MPPFQLTIEPLDEGGFVATSPDVPGLVVEAETIDEVRELAPHIAKAIAETYLAHGDPLPPVFEQRWPGDPCLRILDSCWSYARIR